MWKWQAMSGRLFVRGYGRGEEEIPNSKIPNPKKIPNSKSQIPKGATASCRHEERAGEGWGDGEWEEGHWECGVRNVLGS